MLILDKVEKGKELKRDMLINGDCFDVFKGMSYEKGFLDAIIVDLPYARTKNEWDTLLPLNDYIVLEGKNLSREAYFLECYTKGISLEEAKGYWVYKKEHGLWYYYNKMIKDNGVIIFFGDGMFMSDVMSSNKKQWRYNIVWDKVLKTGFLNANRQPLRQHEEMIVFYKKPPLYNPQKKPGRKNNSKGKKFKSEVESNKNYGDYKSVDNRDKLGEMKHPTSIWTFSKPTSAKSTHATEKPIELLKELLLTYTKEGDLVMDNTMGSGSLVKAAIETKRHFIGIEKDKEIFVKTIESLGQ